MAIYKLRAPNGQDYSFEGPEGATHEQQVDVLLHYHPEAAEAAPPREKGMLAGLKKGAEQLVSSGAAGAQAIFGDATEAGQAASERSKGITGRYEEQTGLKRLGDVYQKEGLFGGAKEVARQIPLALAEQAPNLAAMAGGARLGGMAGSAVLPGWGTAIGAGLGALAPSVLQQLGSNVQRQVEENPEEKVSMARAAPAAIAQGALDVAASAIPMGRTVVGKLLGPGVERLLATGATKQAEKLALERLPALLAKGTATGVATEAPTEATQQMLERWQAGKPLFSDDALKEYAEAAYGAALLGPLGAAGRYANRGAAREAVAEKGRVEAAKAAEAAKQEELNAPTPSTALTTPTEMDTSPARPTNEQVWQQHDAAEAAKVKANEDRKSALAAGDYEAAKQHAATFDEQEALQQDALQRAEPRGQEAAPTAPVEQTAEQLQVRLDALRDGTTAKGKPKLGLINKLWNEGDRAGHDALVAEAAGIQKKLSTIQENSAAFNERGEYLGTQPETTLLTHGTDAVETDPDTIAANLAANAGALRDAATAREIAGMEAGKPVSEEQLSLPMGAPTRVTTNERTPADKAPMLARRVGAPETGEGAQPRTPFVDALRQQIAALPENLTPEQDALVQRIHENLPALAANPERREMAAEWLYRVAQGGQTLLSGEGVGPESARRGGPQDLRARDLSGALDALEQGKRSETQTPTRETPWGTATKPTETAVQGDLLDAAPMKAQTTTNKGGISGEIATTVPEVTRGTLFATKEAFDKFLGGKALNDMRRKMGLTIETISRTMRRVAGLQRKIDTLERSIKAEQEKYDFVKARTEVAEGRAGQIATRDTAADEAHEAAQARLAAVKAKLDAELEPLRGELRAAEAAYKESSDYASDILDTIAENNTKLFQLPQPDVLQALRVAHGYMKEYLRAPVTKDNWDNMRSQQRVIAKLSAKLASVYTGTDTVIGSFLNKNRVLEERMSRELDEMVKLHHAVEAADAKLKSSPEFKRITRNQNRRVAVREMWNTVAEQNRAEAAAKVAEEKRASALEAAEALRANQQGQASKLRTAAGSKYIAATTPLNIKLNAAKERIAALIKAVKDAQKARIPTERKTTQLEREAADAAKRKAGNERGWQAEELPAYMLEGESRKVSFDAQREMRTFLSEFDAREAERKELLAQIEGELKGKGLEDTDKVELEKAKQTVRSEISRDRATKDRYETIMSAQGGKLSALDKKIAAQAVTVENKERLLSEAPVGHPQHDSRKEEHTKAMKKLDAMMEGRRAARGITEVKGEYDAGFAKPQSEASREEWKALTPAERAERLDARRGVNYEEVTIRFNEIADEMASTTNPRERVRLARERNELSLMLTGKLPQRKIGPMERSAVMAGETRSGTAESKAGENKTGGTNAPTQGGKPAATGRKLGKKDIKLANRVSKAAGKGKAAPTTPEQLLEIAAQTVADKERALEQAKARAEAVAKNPKASIADATEAKNQVSSAARELALAEQDLELAEKAAEIKEATAAEAGVEEDPYADDVYEDVRDASGFGAEEIYPNEHDQNILFRSDSKAPVGMSKDEAQAAAAKTMASWKNAPEVIVVQNESELPLRMKGRIRLHKENGAQRVPGFFDTKTGVVYLIADDLRGAHDAATTIIHEIAGHYGLRGLLGEAYTNTMDRLYAGNKDVAAKADAHMKADTKLTRAVAVEEVLADMAEKTPEVGAVKRFLYAIKAALFKRFGLTHVSDSEVKQIVENARRFVEGGKPGGGKPGGGGESMLLRTAADYGKYENSPFAKPLGTHKPDTRSWFQKATEGLGMALETGIADMHAPLIRALDSVADKHDVFQAKYAIREAGASTGWVQAFLSKGTPTLFKDKKGYIGVRASEGTSGVDVYKAAEAIPGANAEAKFDMATKYMMAQRGLRVGADKVGEGVTTAELQKILAFVDADPELKKALTNFRKVYNEYSAGLVNFARDTGYLSTEKAADLLKHGDYVSMYRVRDGQLEMAFGDNAYVKMGDISNTPFLHALKGGAEAVMPVNESLIYNTKLWTDIALTNLAKRNIGYAMSAAGMPNKKMGVLRGAAPTGKEYLSWSEEPKDKDDDGKRWIKLDTEGTAMAGVPTDVLAQSIEGFHATMPAYIKWAAKMNDYLRAGVTRSPIYTLRQLLRDPLSAASTSGMAANPLTAIARAMKEYTNASFGNPASIEELNRKALVQSNVMTGDHDDMVKMSLQFGGGGTPSAVRRLLNMMDSSAHNADAATRVQIYKDSIDRGLSEVEAAYRTRESMNYHKRGSWETIQHANRLFAFFNSSIQAINVATKALQGKMPFEEQLKIKQKFINNTIMLGLGGMAYAAAMTQDDEYAKLKPADRYGNFHMPLPGTDLLLKIPVGYFEGGGAAWALGQAFVDSLGDATDGKQIIKALGTYAATGMPGGGAIPVPTGLKQSVEWMTNTDVRTFRDIVPKALQNQPASEQFTTDTPEAYKAFGNLGISPIKLQHAMDSLVGGLATSAARLLDQTILRGDSAPELTLDRTPIISSIIQNPRSSSAKDEMYDVATHSSEVRAAYDYKKSTGVPAADIEAFVAENRMDLALSAASRTFVKDMAEFNRTMQQINNSGRTPAEKTELKTSLEKRQKQVAEDYAQAIREVKKRLEAAQ